MSKIILSDTNFRTNELLSEQISIIQELSDQLNTFDLKQLEANIAEIELAVNRLKEVITSLPQRI